MIHEQGLVAPLLAFGSIGVVDGRRLSIASVLPAAADQQPLGNCSSLERPPSAALRRRGHQRVTADAEIGNEGEVRPYST